MLRSICPGSCCPLLVIGLVQLAANMSTRCVLLLLPLLSYCGLRHAQKHLSGILLSPIRQCPVCNSAVLGVYNTGTLFGSATRVDVLLLVLLLLLMQAQDMLRNIYLGSCCLLFIIGLVQLAANMNLPSSKTLWGSTCVGVLGVYYTAPLSSLAKVVAEKDSSSLHWPLCGMNIINGMLWFAYGLVSEHRTS